MHYDESELVQTATPTATQAPLRLSPRSSKPTPARSSTPEIPTADIKLGGELKRGGMGAIHTGNWLGVAVAVKTVSNPGKHEMLLREAALLASLLAYCLAC